MLDALSMSGHSNDTVTDGPELTLKCAETSTSAKKKYDIFRHILVKSLSWTCTTSESWIAKRNTRNLKSRVFKIVFACHRLRRLCNIQSNTLKKFTTSLNCFMRALFNRRVSV